MLTLQIFDFADYVAAAPVWLALTYGLFSVRPPNVDTDMDGWEGA